MSLDTIPSVLGEYKPLQVVRCVKNKYLFSRLFFADLGSKKFRFRCVTSGRKSVTGDTNRWDFRGGNQVLARPAAALPVRERGTARMVSTRVFPVPVDSTIRTGRRCLSALFFSSVEGLREST